MAGGVGYRIALGDSGVTAFAIDDRSVFRLGTAADLPLDFEGSITNFAIGAKKEWRPGPTAKSVATLEVTGRRERATIDNVPFSLEDIRILRASFTHESGIPYGIRERVAASVSVGLDGLDASDRANPMAAASGTTSRFLRMMGSAEGS